MTIAHLLINIRNAQLKSNTEELYKLQAHISNLLIDETEIEALHAMVEMALELVNANDDFMP